MRVFLDASVLIAALLSPTGGSHRLITLKRVSNLHLITSQTVIEEIKEHTEKIRRSSSEIDEFIAENGILVREAITEAETSMLTIIVDPDDAHLIIGARSTQCTYLVTLDKKHLLRDDIKRRVKNPKIVSPQELLMILL